ncbi:MAG: Crp/Fnr family transcriptional regulator [bacterium]|nr:Crp/Fnr family transcriptional regulator [bacterium]
MTGRHRVSEGCTAEGPARLGSILLARLGPRKSPLRLRARQIIFHEGTPAAVYCILSGKAKVFKTGPDGKQYIFKIAARGDALALESIFSSGPMSSSAETVEEAEVYPVEPQRARELICQDSALMLRVIEDLASSLRVADQERLELAQAHVSERMAHLLTDLAAEHGVSECLGVRIGLSLSRDELAALIGTAQETAIRQLRAFQKSRLIRLKGRSITVLDRNRLARRTYQGG